MLAVFEHLVQPEAVLRELQITFSGHTPKTIHALRQGQFHLAPIDTMSLLRSDAISLSDKLELMRLLTAILLVLPTSAASAEYRITRDHGGLVEDYKAKYARIRDHGERVIIDGICNSGCTVVLGIVPLNRVCVTPRASLGFHMAYFDKAATGGVKVMSYAGTEELMSYYPEAVKDWL